MKEMWVGEVIIWHDLNGLPDDAGQVLAVAIKDDSKVVSPAWYEGNGRFHSQSGEYLRVILWAYMPSGPKGEE